MNDQPNPAPSGPVQTEQFSSPGSQRASCPEAVNDGDALDCPLPGGEPAPDRHEASRAAFEEATDNTGTTRDAGRYITSLAQLEWEAWCRALDHAAQEQPAQDGSAVEIAEDETRRERLQTEAYAHATQCFREDAEFLRTKLAATERRVERLRGALEDIATKCEHFLGCPVGPATIAEIARAALAETKEDAR